MLPSRVASLIDDLIDRCCGQVNELRGTRSAYVARMRSDAGRCIGRAATKSSDLIVVSPIAGRLNEAIKEGRMRSMTALLVFIGMVLCLGAGPVAAQRLSADQEDTIKADVSRAFDECRRWLMKDRPDLVARHRRFPWLRLQPSGPVTISTDSQVGAWFEDTLRPLVAEGYERTEGPVLRICVSMVRRRSSAASISGIADGSVIGEYGASYVFPRSRADWQIVSTIPHDPQKLVLC